MDLGLILSGILLAWDCALGKCTLPEPTPPPFEIERAADAEPAACAEAPAFESTVCWTP